MRQTNDRKEPPFPSKGEEQKIFTISFLVFWCWCWDPFQLRTEDICVYLIVRSCFGSEKETSLLLLSIRENWQKHTSSRCVPLSDMLPLFCCHEEWQRMVTCGVHMLKRAPAQVLGSTRQHWHRPVCWQLQRVERRGRIQEKVVSWAEILTSSFLCEVLPACFTRIGKEVHRSACQCSEAVDPSYGATKNVSAEKPSFQAICNLATTPLLS